ncbi:MAG TPA: substrate-binding domain-containing protein, partial [Pseudonocardia sp.]|nr:substrate-binding domain-containing protein [Pseudonocardia sp.]
WEALREAAQEKELTAVRLGPYPPFMAGGPAAADAAIGSGATAVIAFNALLAIGVLRRCADRGIRVPEDISIAGYDDIFGADFCSPPLTTVASPIQDVGRAAVDLLLGRLTTHQGRREPHGVTLPCYLRIRDSTGRAPGGERGDPAG